MTRKRFIKLLMGYGVQRNAAFLAADRVIVGNRSYEAAYREMCLSLNIRAVTRSFERFKRVARQAVLIIDE